MDCWMNNHPNDPHQPGAYPDGWCQNGGEGKVFYTSSAIGEDVWESRYSKAHLGGHQWALRLEQGSAEQQVTK